MNTGDIFETRPAAAPSGPTPPAPGAKPSKRGREFASVMDQTMKSAHARATKSSAAGRSGATDAAEPARSKIVRLPKHDAGGDGAEESRKATPAAEGQTEGLNDGKPVSGKRTRKAAQSADAAGQADAVVDENSEAATGGTQQQEPPSNIIPFPTQPPASSVIIPFPLEAAKAAGRLATAESGTTVAASDTAGEAPVPAAEAAVDGKILQISTSVFRKGSAATPTELQSDKGIAIEKLGLKPVMEERVAPEKPAATGADAPARVETEDTPKPPDTIVAVTFRKETSQPGTKAAVAAESHLPGQAGVPEEIAPQTAGRAEPKGDSRSRSEVQNPAVHAALPRSGRAEDGSAETTGIPAARKEEHMESLSNSDRDGAASGHGAESVDELPAVAPETSRDEAVDLSVRNLVATEWQTGWPVSSSDRPASSDAGIDAATTVERITKLVQVEAALVKKHNSDSMAVVLRPDAETELFVHFTQREGLVEATIRCERGDAQQLGALWSQLQESLAQQKVRLAPLQESPSNHSNFNQSSGSHTSGGNNSSPRQQPGGKHFMDEWPVPASSSSDASHVRGRGGSRQRRVTTSRPGWETWA